VFGGGRGGWHGSLPLAVVIRLRDPWPWSAAAGLGERGKAGRAASYPRRVVVFPDDGHPDLAAAALDLTGDPRDEVLLWDPERVWIYTQDRPSK